MYFEQAWGAKYLAQAPSHGSLPLDRGRRRREPRLECRMEDAGDAHWALCIIQWSPQDCRNGTDRPTDGQILGQDGVRAAVDERAAQDTWDRQVVDDEEGHRDDPGARLEPQLDVAASA